MSQDQKYRKLPTKRRGGFLSFVDETSMGRLALYGILAYVGVVVLISLVEFAGLKLFGFQWVQYSGGGEVGFWDTIYFNLVTILTVGYGDISPNGLGKVFSTIEALFGIGLFAGAISLLTVKALRPSPDTIVFSKYAYYCLDEQRFMVIFLNTSVSRLENCSISSYFKVGRDWQLSPAISPPFLTTAVQTFFIDRHSEEEIREKLMDGDCLRVCISGTLLGSKVAASVQYKPHEILILQNRKYIASYEPFWRPNLGDPEFVRMFHYKPEGAETLAERFAMNEP